MSDLPLYAIASDCDRPCPELVCQWVAGVGYCYLDRRKAVYDGMRPARPTVVAAFGFDVFEDRDAPGTVTFVRSDAPSTATYADGAARVWQDRAPEFTLNRLTRAVVRVRDAGEVS